MTGTDATHWLHRLSPEEWLAAAQTELGHCEEALARRAARPGVTHARRSAGMALNAVLALREDPRFGRSYMDHLVALSTDKTASEEARTAAQRLREIPAAPPALLTLGQPDLRALRAAAAIVAYARARTQALRQPPV
jgi:hypothetical protein